ncbi:hypothetical protein ACFWM3_06335 [Gottfriedia sp. NPDC058432]|uniref:hypothetical protein n=1 Tax=Gottfriedia sp. NPDC058432 TaxID=3346497 RepID=UPI0036557D05
MYNLNGSFIKGKELEELRKRVFCEASFRRLEDAIAQYIPFKKGELEIKHAYEFNFQPEESLLITGKQILFMNNLKTIQIVYRESFSNELNEKDALHAHILVPNNNGKSLLSLCILDSKINIETIDDNYPYKEIKIVEEDLPDNPNFNLNQSNVLTAKYWFNKNGCLPGGYQHCGGNCGKTGDYGGGKAINYTDSCCKLHDDCYRSGVKKCKCDTMLINCIRNESTIVSMAIRLYFGPGAC